MSRRTLLLVALLLPAADWPQWRGPNRDAHSPETGLLAPWPAGGAPVAWKATGLGGGYGSVSVVNGKVFGMGYVGDDEVVWALNEADGGKLWRTTIAGKARAGYGEGSRCTPTVDGGMVYVVGMGGEVAALAAETGKVVWKKNLKDDFGGKMMSGWGYSESPLVDGDKLVVTPGGDSATIVALDKKTGKQIWKSAVPNGGGAGYASVVKAEAGGVAMYVTWLGKAAVGVSAKDGKLLWRNETAAGNVANIPTAVVKDDFVVVSTGYTGRGGITGLQLVPDGRGGVAAKEVWQYPSTKVGNHHGGMVLVGDYLYLGHGQNKGQPTCIELKTGKIQWGPEREPKGCSGSAAVLYADGKLFFRYQNHALAIFEANPNELKVLSVTPLPESSGKASWPHPTLANGKLYLRDQDKMFVFSVKAAA